MRPRLDNCGLPAAIDRDASSSADGFLATVPSFRRFGQILDPQLYAALPDDWVVGLSDVVGSTQAIEAGHYKKVNMAGAAVIAALSNALGNAPYPFVFGGDGASFAYPSNRTAARHAGRGPFVARARRLSGNRGGATGSVGAA